MYLRALLKELRDAGVLAADAEVASFEELLTALEGTSGVLAATVDVPPLNVPSVRTSWQELQRQAADLPDVQEPPLWRSGRRLGRLHQLSRLWGCCHVR